MDIAQISWEKESQGSLGGRRAFMALKDYDDSFKAKEDYLQSLY